MTHRQSLYASIIVHLLLLLPVGLSAWNPGSSRKAEKTSFAPVSLVGGNTTHGGPKKQIAKVSKNEIRKPSQTPKTPIPTERVQAQTPSSDSVAGSSAGISGAGLGAHLGGGSGLLDFRDELRAAIEQEKEYPPLARARRQTGRVLVGFTLRKDGRIENARVVTASAFDRLNEAALLTIQRLGKFKPVPDSISKGDWEVTVPMEFRILD